MLAAKRLLCAAAVVLCWPAAAAFAQSANPAAPPAASDGAAPVPALPNAVTPPPPRAEILSDPNRPADDRSPLLNPQGAGNPNLPLLPNASPEEPALRAPLLRIDTP